MQNLRTGLLFSTFLGALLVTGAVSAQDKPAPPSSDAAPALTMTGCVSPKPGASGQYMFQESETIAQYRLNGKNIKKFAGQRVEIVIGSRPKLAVGGGL